MNNENLVYLRNDLKYLGFGEDGPMHQQFEQEIAKDQREFELHTEAFFDEMSKLEARLHFRKMEAKDRYIFWKYDATLIYPDDAAKTRMQTFYIYKGTGVTFKEGFNLLQGRSVYKELTNLEGEKYHAWVQLNFDERDSGNNYRLRQFREPYHYELEKVLEKYPIREMMGEDTKALLIRSLKRGNTQLVTFDKPNKSEKMYIEASPMFKTINIYPLSTKGVKKNRTNTYSPFARNASPGEPLMAAREEEVPEEETVPARK